MVSTLRTCYRTTGRMRTDNGRDVVIKRSKTDQTAKGQVRPLAADATRIQVWIDAAQIQTGPLFRPIHNSFGGTWKVKPKRMNRDAASVAIVKRALQVGIEGVTSHSFRRAFAQDLLKGGFRTPEIMEAGGWKSAEMVSIYTRGTECAWRDVSAGTSTTALESRRGTPYNEPGRPMLWTPRVS